jgi:hypothetical protein
MSLAWKWIFIGSFVMSTDVSSTASESPRIVVLTFDDSVKSHRTYVGPLLHEYGFGATFFITHGWMKDTENFMSWTDIAELQQMGFEIGNHTWTHLGLSKPEAAQTLPQELHNVDEALAKVGFLNQSVLRGPEKFQEYMDYLINGDFRVIALRKSGNYLDLSQKPKDPMELVRFP